MTRRQRISKLRRGTNQHTKKHKPFQSTYWNFLILPVVLTIGLWVRMTVPFIEEATTVKSVHGSSYISPLPEPSPDLPLEKVTLTPALDHERSPKPVEGAVAAQVEDYIREVFGDAGDIAVAVSRRECNPNNSKYPACILHTEHEYSVGVFQINLFNSRGWIHAGKVPGDSMDEKIEWLKDPYNNVKLAYQIYQDWGGFAPWTAYTNGSYLKELGGGEHE